MEITSVNTVHRARQCEAVSGVVVVLERAANKFQASSPFPGHLASTPSPLPTSCHLIIPIHHRGSCRESLLPGPLYHWHPNLPADIPRLGPQQRQLALQVRTSYVLSASLEVSHQRWAWLSSTWIQLKLCFVRFVTVRSTKRLSPRSVPLSQMKSYSWIPPRSPNFAIFFKRTCQVPFLLSLIVNTGRTKRVTNFLIGWLSGTR